MVSFLLLQFQIVEYLQGESGYFRFQVFIFLQLQEMTVQLLEDGEELILVCGLLLIKFKYSFLEDENKIANGLIVGLLLMPSCKTRIN